MITSHSEGRGQKVTLGTSGFQPLTRIGFLCSSFDRLGTGLSNVWGPFTSKFREDVLLEDRRHKERGGIYLKDGMQGANLARKDRIFEFFSN